MYGFTAIASNDAYRPILKYPRYLLVSSTRIKICIIYSLNLYMLLSSPLQRRLAFFYSRITQKLICKFLQLLSEIADN